MKQVTAEDVAKLAGVSRSAVSRAFTSGARISAGKRDLVLEAAKQLNYRPNTIAASLARRRSNLVAILINQLPNLRDPYFYNALIFALQKTGRVPLMVCVDPADRDMKAIQQVTDYQVEAMIIMSDGISARWALEVSGSVPPIMLNANWTPDDQVHRLTLDAALGISQMLEHLTATGHRKLAFINGRPTSADSNARRTALVDGMVKYGMILVGERYGNFVYEDGFLQTQKFLEQSERPDVIFCANDVMAMGAIDAIRDGGELSIPKDIAVVGFDDIPSAQWHSYDLSTIRRNSEDLVSRVVDLVEAGGDAAPELITIATQFIPRKTVRSLS